ncbi:Ubiquitin-like modifier-activating enzyme [Podosphaera aphanis]|nr:Ubiquitin-like modifier-activating enzyme [Podosphaera aphanis]
MSLRNIAPELAIKFAPFCSEIELPFFYALSQTKIDHDRLNDSAQPVLGLYEHRLTTSPDASCRMQILGNALVSENVPVGHIRAEGKIKNLNTIEDFRNIDKAALLKTAAKQIWNAINDGTIYSIPSLLASFTVISFADLKKYNFIYWFGFPALHSNPVWTRHATDKPDQLTGLETSALAEEYGSWRYVTDAREHGFFLAKRVRSTDENSISPQEEDAGNDLGYKWVIGSLRKFESGFFDVIPEKDRFIAFVDPSTYPDHPGWVLRNLLVLIRQRFKLKKANILCYRDTHSRRHEARSLILTLETQGIPTPPNEMPTITGWERNSVGKFAPKATNLAQYMDPKLLANMAVELNTKLIKWRLAPSLDLEKIKAAKCLLLGAGTLGTYVSRLLLGWNVKTINFVDNALISYSNPVRQPLFDFVDCLNGGSKKAPTAATALKKIFPGVDSTGYAMTVPMLGHPVVNEEESRSHFETLEKLFDEHDVIFLLMDTRESRWLPTVMGKAKNKLILNAALGFDSWVVMRHGVFSDAGPAPLGCYFCNDVVVPADSLKDRTLDQQCTVTRPGIAPMAAAQAVELFASILQHPLGVHAPAPCATKDQKGSLVEYDRDPADHPLGLVPHQIRGFAATFQNLIIKGQSYDNCSACSSRIVHEYKEKGWDFVKKALSDKKYVLELSGLAEVQRLAELALNDVDWSEGEGGIDLDDDDDNDDLR